MTSVLVNYDELVFVKYVNYADELAFAEDFNQMNALMRKKFKLKPPNLHNDHEKHALLHKTRLSLCVAEALICTE
jgi:hypothetical protein